MAKVVFHPLEVIYDHMVDRRDQHCRSDCGSVFVKGQNVKA